MDAETRRMVQEEVRRQVNIILFGATGETDPVAFTEDIQSLYPGMPAITKRPVMHPYGFVSVPLKDTISVTARVGDHIGNRLVIGHRDADRPTDLEAGESAVYSSEGQAINVRNGKIEIGATGADEPLVLGNVMIDFCTEVLKQLDTLLQTLAQTPVALTTTPGNPVAPNPGFVTEINQVKAALTTAKSTYISTVDTNIVSQESFTQRGGQ